MRFDFQLADAIRLAFQSEVMGDSEAPPVFVSDSSVAGMVYPLKAPSRSVESRLVSDL